MVGARYWTTCSMLQADSEFTLLTRIMDREPRLGQSKARCHHDRASSTRRRLQRVLVVYTAVASLRPPAASASNVLPTSLPSSTTTIEYGSQSYSGTVSCRALNYVAVGNGDTTTLPLNARTLIPPSPLPPPTSPLPPHTSHTHTHSGRFLRNLGCSLT